MEKSNIVEQLKKHLAETPKEELDKEFEELNKWNDIGPTIEEYVKDLKDGIRARVKYGKEIIHNLESSGQDKKNKSYYERMKSDMNYWENVLEELDKK